MKIKIKNSSIDEVLKIQQKKRKKPSRPSLLFKFLIRVLSIPELNATKFKYKKTDMEKAGKGPWLILMNHSSFIDLKIASKLFFNKQYNIISTTDGFVGKSLLMRLIGCVPTQKFVTDLSLVGDMAYCFKKGRSVLMFPEAGYSFDGTSTVLPKKMGAVIKKFGVPVVTVITDGAFLRNPLYNELQIRKVNTFANVKCLLSSEEIKNKSVQEIDELIEKEFSFDNFKNQRQNKVSVKEPFRADGLHRILYRCPHCQTENKMVGKGETLTCTACNKAYFLNEFGELVAVSGATEFSHIPDWFNWQRECVKKEIEDGVYHLEAPVKVGVIADEKCLYIVGDGTLSHDRSGLKLTLNDNNYEYFQPSNTLYTLNADYFWYEIGDMISIGNKERLYYCFTPKNISVTKARLATEEIYKMIKAERKK